MPRLEDLPNPLKSAPPYQRKRLRPWDDISALKPVSDAHKGAEKPENVGQQLVNNKETIGKQLDNIKETNREQLVNNKETIGKQLDNIKETNWITIGKQQGEAIGKQLDNELDNAEPEKARVIEVVKKLYGHQKKLLFYIVENCKSRKFLHTTPIENETLRKLLNTDRNSVKTTVQRLIQKELIGRNEGKRGKGGFYVFTVSKAAIEAVIEAEWELSISKQLDNELVNSGDIQLVNNKETNWITHPLSSSSICKATTTKEPVDNFLPSEWRLVKIEPLEEIGFTHQHLNQLANQGKLQASIVQESIHAFSFDLRHNGKSEKLKSSPLNYLMGILRNGQPYAPPANYESPTQEAWRLYYERKEAIRKRQQELEAKLAALSFDEWLEKEVTEEQKKEIIPTMIYKLPSEAPKLAQMRNHFMSIVWPEKRKKIVEECGGEMSS